MATGTGSELTVQSAAAPVTEYVYTPQASQATAQVAAAPYVENVYTPRSSEVTAQSTAPAVQYLAGSGLTAQSGQPVVSQFGVLAPAGSQLTVAMPNYMDIGNDFVPDGSELIEASGTGTTALNLPIVLLPAGSEMTAQSTTTRLTELLLPVGSQMTAQTTLVTGLRLFPFGSEISFEKTLSIVTLILVYPVGYTGDVLILARGTLTIPGGRAGSLTVPAAHSATLSSSS